MTLQIETPETWQIAEAVVQGYFPNLSAGLNINGKTYIFRRGNRKNKFEIDWAVFCNDNRVAVIDTELKPGWNPPTPGWSEYYSKYPFWTVAIYGWRYNTGKTDRPYVSGKVRYYREYPDQSFWMPVRSDYKEAGIITGRKVIDSDVIIRDNANGMARPIELYEFPKKDIVFCNVFETDIEDFVIEQLDRVGVFNGHQDN